jgi:hypothetical protein
MLPSIKLGRHARFVRSDVAEAIEQLRLGRVATRRDASGAPDDRAMRGLVLVARPGRNPGRTPD